MGNSKRSAAEKAARRKEAREAFNRSNRSHEPVVKLDQGFRDNLGHALSNGLREEILETTGLPFNRLAKIASGIAPNTREAEALQKVTSIKGWKPLSND